MLFDEKPVRGYTALLSADSILKLKENTHPFLVVNLSATTGSVTINGKLFHKKGDFYFIPAGSKNEFINTGAADASLVIFELK